MVGHNGYLAIVPGTEYAACSVHASWAGREGYPPGTWVSTDVRHVGDDPLWKMLPETGDSAGDHRAMNVIHRAPYRQVCALTREYGRHVYEPMESAWAAEKRMVLRKAQRTLADWRSISMTDGSMGVVRESGSLRYLINEAGDIASCTPQEKDL